MKYFLTKFAPLILIVLLGAILRFWQLGSTPASLFVDEASNGYNAYSILHTGKDEYGNFMPLTFRAFGDYNPALSVYLLVPSIAVFGLNEFAVRFPSALLGSITIFLTYLLTLKLFSSKKIALLAAFFLAISPWHIQFSRYDHEANFMVSFTILALVLFHESKKNFKYLIFSALAFGLALNTYHAAKLLIPIIIVLTSFWYFKDVKKHGLRVVLVFCILLISALPIILNFKHSLIRAQSVTVTKNNEKFISEFIYGYLSHFSPNFLLTTADQIPRHYQNGMGLIYMYEAPLIILGLLQIIKTNSKSSKYILMWLLLAPIPAALATPAPHALRAITFLPLWSMFCAFGLTFLLTQTKRLVTKILLLFLVIVAFYNVLTYLHLYYVHEPRIRALDWSDGYKQMIAYVKDVEKNYQSIAISSYWGKPYVFVLFYTKYDPNSYHKHLATKSKEDDFNFDKYEFFGSSWKKTKPGKALIVTPPWQSHPDNVLQEIKTHGGESVFTISETE